MSCFGAWKQKVAVIGAGLAGLTAAYRLDQKGYDVDVFEARNRVGGRVHSILMKNDEGGYSVGELGGQNIADGGEARHLLSLAQELNLDKVEDDNAFSALFYDGQTFHEYNALLKSYLTNAQHIEKALDSLEASAHSMQDVLDGLFPKDPLLKRILDFHLASYEGSPTPLLCPYHNMNVLKSIIFGHLPSARQPSTDTAPIFHRVTLKGGNASLPLKIKEKMNSRIHLNKVLKEARTGDEDRLMLFFQDGSMTLCDQLILAVPCSIYNDISFDDKVIPLEKLQEIKHVQYGSNGKILVPVTGGRLTHNGVMTDKMLAFFMEESKVLSLYFSRDSGQNLLKNLKDLFQEARAALKSGFKGSSLTEQLPVIANDDQLTLYDKPVAKSWWEDIYAKGSYSNFGVDLKEQFDEKMTYKGVTVKAMFEPVDDRVFFVGEHTTILDVIGTMEAAVESGNRISGLF